MKGLIFTYALTYGGAAFSLYRPFYGLLIYVAFAIIKPEVTWHWSVPPGNYSRIVAIALLVGWAAHGFGSWSFGKAKIIALCYTAFMLMALVSAIFAPNQAVGFAAVESMAKIYIPFIVGLTLIEDWEQISQLAWVIVLSAGYVAFEQNLTYVTHGIPPWQTDNLLAHQCAVAGGLAFLLGYYSTSLLRKACSLACSVILVHAVMIHMSRGAMIGLVTIGAACLVVLPKSPRFLLFVALSLVAIGYLAGPSIREEFLSSFKSHDQLDGSAVSRFELWSAMWDASLDNSIVGVGPNHWPLIAHEYGFTRGKEGHGLWPQMICEYGFVGGVAYVGLFASAILVMTSIALRRQWGQTPGVVWAQIAVPPIVGFVVEAWFGSFEGLELSYYVILLGAGALKLHSRPTIAVNLYEVSSPGSNLYNSVRLPAVV